MDKEKYCVKFRGFRCVLIAAALAAVFAATGLAQFDTYLPWEGGASYYEQWPLGLRHDQDFFPIGTWDQSPWNAPLFQGIGFNTWVALYDGTVEIDPGDGPLLPLLRDYGVPLIGDQASALQNTGTDPMTGRSYASEAAEHLTDPIIAAWMQQDEPDNAQTDANGNYVDCVPPSPAYYNSTDTGAPGTVPGPSVLTLYNQFKAADPSRPVYLGLGQGTGWDNDDCYYGRGSTCCSAGRGLSDYRVYAQGGDILDADVYPQNDGNPMWWTARKTDRLRYWSNYKKPAWDDQEMNDFDDQGITLTPAEIDAEFWESIIHGGHGIVWFTHEFAPTFEEDSAFSPEHAGAEAQMALDNIQVNALARVLNQPSVANGMLGPVTLTGNQNAGVNYMLKRYGGYTFLFTQNDGLPQHQTQAANPITETSAFCATEGCEDAESLAMGSQHMLPVGGVTATFTLAGFPPQATATVIGENLTVDNLPTVGTVNGYITVCGGGFWYYACGGGVATTNRDGTFATPVTPYYFAATSKDLGIYTKQWLVPAGTAPTVYAQASATGAYRTIPIVNGVFTDNFANSYTRHIYQINFDPNRDAALIGDVNGDGVVNYADYAIVQAAQGTTAGMPGYDPRADVIRDGTVNQADLLVIAQKIADVNHDGVVNCTDYDIVKNLLGRVAGQPGWYPPAAIDGNFVIDAQDLAIVTFALNGQKCN
jgi:hypothetical protein